MKAPITLRTKGRLKTFGGGEGNWDCATDAVGSMDISRGNSKFIVYLDSIWFGQIVAFALFQFRVRKSFHESAYGYQKGNAL
jgi:hypothetical protein